MKSAGGWVERGMRQGLGPGEEEEAAKETEREQAERWEARWRAQ